MKRRTLLSVLLSACLAFALPLRAQAAPPAIAAAGDLRGVLEELTGAFEARHPGAHFQLTFGASGNLTVQIQQGAPFDIFLAADTGFPETVVKAGLATGDGTFPYAKGSLTLWVRKDLHLDPARDGLRVLLHPSVKKVATANPQVAPYGRAGDAALRRAGLFEAVKPKLVFGDNIAQAAQFLQAGAAEAGLISGSQARNPVLQNAGTAWKVPADAYPPLVQAGVILKRTAHLERARAFMAFLVGPDGQAILARHGFARP
ncbi:molybdate ABC transporter substrate-binding protein [Mesoterricola silvestris]|uniref:Molybdate ABC transporter substrate-binding protein n=1 Tax=Mesoterricola silvestris TaxID=2927979 RepID=A0AA48KAD8_9BACT|nr:molybdate ABC transporter substrate-binding protein [Mesoterricola silvestris]BDU73207.1 molybdate ABC transporter substrate-binding protein [Mesoterricola silvestris]